MLKRLEQIIPTNHPAIPGHFPGHPVVPGALLLEYVSAAMYELYQHIDMIDKIIQAKFILPILPEQPFTICLKDQDNQRMVFELQLNQNVYAKGIIGYRSCD